MNLVVGVPPQILSLQQSGLIQRAFHDGLFPNLSFRQEALREEWPAHAGTELIITRPGLLSPVVKPNTAGADPLPQAVPFEQWYVRLLQFASTIDTHVPTAATAAQELFIRNIHQLGLQAGQSINRIARNALCKPYLSGSTVLIAAALTADTSIRVAALSGFTDVVVPNSQVRPAAVSSTNPLAITIGTGGTKRSNTVIGFQPDNLADPDGPGTLLLGSAVGGAGFASRVTVDSAYAPIRIRSGGAATIDGIATTDTFLLQLAINAVAKLRANNVPPHEDGYYHAHLPPGANAQLFADPVFQRLNQSIPEGKAYGSGFVGATSGILFFMDNESPDYSNCGSRTLTGTNAYYSEDIAAETTNDAGTNIGRVIITGKGCLYEKWFDESKHFVTEAGITGKVGDFSVVNNGISIPTDGIRLVLRSPMDRLQQMVAATWSISTAFAAASDITAPGPVPARYRRAIVIEYAA